MTTRPKEACSEAKYKFIIYLLNIFGVLNTRLAGKTDSVTQTDRQTDRQTNYLTPYIGACGFFFNVGPPQEDIFFDHLLQSIFQSTGYILQITIFLFRTAQNLHCLELDLIHQSRASTCVNIVNRSTSKPPRLDMVRVDFLFKLNLLPLYSLRSQGHKKGFKKDKTKSYFAKYQFGSVSPRFFHSAMM